MIITIANGISSGFVLGFEFLKDVRVFTIHLGLISIYFQRV
jgi:hypothetical protein